MKTLKKKVKFNKTYGAKLIEVKSITNTANNGIPTGAITLIQFSQDYMRHFNSPSPKQLESYMRKMFRLYFNYSK